MSLFIDLPWSKNVAHDMYASEDQVREVYNIIVKAFIYKYAYEKAGGNKGFDLSDVKVFNNFVNDAVDKILDPVARDYVLETIRHIRDNNFRKKSVQTSYETLYSIFNPALQKYTGIRSILADSLLMIDFCYLFKKCNKIALTKQSSEIKEIISMYNALNTINKSERNLF